MLDLIGDFALLGMRPRFEVTGAFKSPRDIEDLTIRASPVGPVVKTSTETRPGELIFLKDVARVRTGYTEPPRSRMRRVSRRDTGRQCLTVGGRGHAHDRALSTLPYKRDQRDDDHDDAYRSDHRCD